MSKVFDNCQRSIVKCQSKAGFTLLEVLLVVAAIAILAGIVIVALNPSKQLGDTRNAERWSDVDTIMEAVYQYSIDNNGDMPDDIDEVTTTLQMLGTATGGCDSACPDFNTVAACVDLTSDLVPDYIVDIPKDPSSGFDSKTDYYINKDVNERIVVGACDPEQSEVIEIER